MPSKRKRKKRFNPNPELKDLPHTKKAVNEMFEQEWVQRQIDEAQANLLKLQLEVSSIKVEFEKIAKENAKLRSDISVLLKDRAAAIRTLSVVLGQQIVASVPA